MGLPPTIGNLIVEPMWACDRCSYGQTTIFHPGGAPCPNDPPAAVVTCPHCGGDVALEVK